MKRRISLTIDSGLLEQVDKYIDNREFDSRSAFVEHCLSNHIQSSSTAVILAGGDPEKLKINGKFKFLLPLGGEKTLLDYLLESLAGFGKIYIVGHREVINSCFERVSEKYGKTEIQYVEERKVLGNAKTLELVKNKLPQTFLILPIDQYYELDFFDMIRRHHMNHSLSKSLVTLVVSPVSTTRQYARISMIGSRIVEHEEKIPGKKNLISAFAAVCDRQIFDYIPQGEIRWELQTDVYPKLIKKDFMSGYLMNSPFFDIASESDLHRLAKYLKSK